MKTKPIIVVGVLAALAVAYVVSIIPNIRQRSEWKRTVAALRSLSPERVNAAAEAFARDRKTNFSTVPLRELVSGGYLRPEDVRGLEGRDASVSLASNETTLQVVWVRVRAADGCDIVLLADGSIQKMVRR